MLTFYFIVIIYIIRKSISWGTIKLNHQENLININERANSRLAETDDVKQDGGPQTLCTKRICKKFDNVATRDLERTTVDDKSL